MHELNARNYIHYTQAGQLNNVATDGNFIAFSELSAFHAALTPKPVVGLKYVLRGEENYVVNGTLNRVKSGQLLVVDQLESGEAFCKPAVQKTIGLCINIDKALVDEVVNSYGLPLDEILDYGQPKVNYNLSLASLQAEMVNCGRQMQQLANALTFQPTEYQYYDKDFFYQLTVNLLKDHQEFSQKSASLKSAKKSTRLELLRRLTLAKATIDDQIAQRIEMAVVAANAGLSEFYFCRSFKQLYGMSPYQYVLQQKLNRAKIAIETGANITETAFRFNFSDIFSFSKAFKKRFGIAPSLLSKK